jgi:hypothetical protein
MTIERLLILQGGHNLFSDIASGSQYGFAPLSPMT